MGSEPRCPAGYAPAACGSVRKTTRKYLSITAEFAPAVQKTTCSFASVRLHWATSVQQLRFTSFPEHTLDFDLADKIFPCTVVQSTLLRGIEGIDFDVAEALRAERVTRTRGHDGS